MTHTFNKDKLIAFTQEIDRLKKEIYSSISEADFKHLLKIERWGKLATIFGYATAWIIPNPITAFLISIGQSTRWLMAHHILHRGYDKVPNIPMRYTSKGFAQGYRRFLDWFDWIHPKAWDYEHNILHHYNTGEHLDPDLVERNAEFLRKSRWPVFFKYLFMIFFGVTWKYTYYAPNTMSCLDKNNERINKDELDFLFLKDVFLFSDPRIKRLWIHCYAPYFLFNFIFIPLAFLIISQQAAVFVLINRIMAEVILNFHSFLIIGPNHAGEDLHRFDFHYGRKDEFYLTQVLSSVNYNCGKEWLDYMQIWLNYQIEHHLFPDLPMLKYREVQPKVKELCVKYEIPYIQESVFKRFKMMLQVCVGSKDMMLGETVEQIVKI